MKLAGTLFKSGLAVAGAGIYLFFRRLFKKAKNTEKTIEKKVKAKTTAAAKKSTTKARQKKMRETGELVASR
jgi:hypothetical protein